MNTSANIAVISVHWCRELHQTEGNGTFTVACTTVKVSSPSVWCNSLHQWTEMIAMFVVLVFIFITLW